MTWFAPYAGTLNLVIMAVAGSLERAGFPESGHGLGLAEVVGTQLGQGFRTPPDQNFSVPFTRRLTCFTADSMWPW
jgi:hypothetical protein